MKEHIEQINDFLEGAETVVVEAAHIYADKEPGDEQRISAEIGTQISAGLSPRVRKLLLIDDLNITQNTLNQPDYLILLKEWGFIPDEVFLEKDMVPGVIGPDGILEKIKQAKSAKIKNGEGQTKRFWAPNPDRMIKLVKADGIPTCAALDSVFSRQKSTMAQGAVTILPENYMDQQRETQTIMQRAGIVLPTANIYFSPTGGRTLVLNR